MTKSTIPFLTKPAPADGKLVRDATDAAISAIFTDAVKAQEAAKPIDEATVHSDALKTLRDLMLDDYVPHATRVDIAKHIIESRVR